MDLGIDDFHYSDLYDHSRLAALARSFDVAVEQSDGDLFRRFDAYRIAMQNGIAHGALTEPQESELLISVARHLGAFLAQLFRSYDSDMLRFGVPRISDPDDQCDRGDDLHHSIENEIVALVLQQAGRAAEE